ncbi:hypothetical protein K435DRAFT_833587 [Dendrothele bispora CBS 962.96]|uniref:Uncharacterized protein n=1 Tax=Dendrothele bispora (strain CBS 962.96) TaxID=1314807 RepID=A0A4S8MVC5_DENBC|nr:hypothetical protein K435DRAFT_833587 [Dendrothele bispora CBS 962.96]
MPAVQSSTSPAIKTRKCSNILCKYRNSPMRVAGKHRCGGCKYGTFVTSPQEAAVVDAEKRMAEQPPPKPFRNAWENEDGYIIDWKGYEESQRQAKLLEVEKRRKNQAKLDAAERAREQRRAVRVALEEDDTMIDPFARYGPLEMVQVVKKPAFADSEIFELISVPNRSSGDSESQSFLSRSSSRSSGPSTSDSSQSQYPSSVSSLPSSASSTSLAGSFTHRFDKPLPKLPAHNSVRYDVTPPLTLKKSKSENHSESSNAGSYDHKHRSQPGYHDLKPRSPPPTCPLPPMPTTRAGRRNVTTIPARTRPISTLDVPQEIDSAFHDF